MSEYTVREQKLRRMKALRRRQVRRQKILLGCMTGILVCAAAGVLLYSRSYTLDLKTRLIPETTVREAKPLLGGKMEQALAETTQLAVKNSGTKVIAHRGYSSEAPENTLPAYELAAQSGVWGIEADIHKTADGAFICMHDPTVDRMTDGSGTIAEMTLGEIQMLTVDSGSNSWAYPYAGVPTMEEFLEVCQQSGSNAVLDLKFTAVEDVVPLIQKIQEFGMEESVVCLSGNLDQLKKIRECSEVIRVKYLVEEGTQEAVDQVAELSHSGISAARISGDVMAYAKDRGVSVNVWTYNKSEEKQEWTRQEVDFLTTDDLST
nr:glycerophosphodiester phosphodiesterase family protein [uncultured Faecalimonas sp.]